VKENRNDTLLLLPEKLASEIRPVHREVKHFVTNEFSYYGVTDTGFLFDIIKSKNIQPPIEKEEDFYCYLWLECVRGFYLLRQRFIKDAPQEWYLEVEIIPRERYPLYFVDMLEYFKENEKIMMEICEQF